MSADALADPAIMQGVESAREEIHEFFANDPILRIANGLLKLGVTLAAIGVIATYAAPSLLKSATNERNDMEDALGFPHTVLPGQPAPPPPPAPFYVTDIAGVLWNYLNLSVWDSAANISQLGAAQANLVDLWDNALAQRAPGATMSAILQVQDDFQAMMGTMTSDPPDWAALANFVAGPSSIIVWGTKITLKPQIWSDINALEACFGITQTFDTQPQSASSSGTYSPWGFVVQDLTNFVALMSGNGTLALVTNYGAAFAEDVYKDATTFFNDVESIAGDIAQGLGVIGNAIVNFPRILGDTAGMIFNWTLGQLFAWLGPILAWVGVAMAIAGGILLFVYQNIWPKAEARFKLAANARMARVWNWVDTKLKTRKKITAVNKAAATEVAIDTANERAAPTVISEPIVASPPALAAGAAADKPAEGGGAVNPTPSTPEPAPPTPGAVEPTATAPLPPPETQVVVEKGGVNVQAPVEPPAGVMTEAEATQYLGDRPNRAPTPEELREMADEAERERRKTRKPEKTDEPNREQLMELAAA